MIRTLRIRIRNAKFSKTVPAACLFSALLTGCSVSTDFYMPSASGGRVERAHCPPVSSFILFERNGVIVGVKSTHVTRTMLEIVMTLEVPQKVVLKLSAPEVTVTGEGNFVSQGVLAPSGRHSDLPWDIEWVGSTQKRLLEKVTLYDTTEHAYYVFRSTVEFPESETHQIVLPGFFINGEKESVPPISFQRASGSWLFSGNC